MLSTHHRLPLALAIVSALSLPLAARAAPETNASAITATSTATLDTVTVTGTRAQGRTVRESAAPIDVLSAEDIRAANATSLLDVLNTTVPSFNLPLETGDLNSMVRAGQLRGLNSSHVLVLVDGKRRHATALLGAGGFGGAAPADLALIPTGAIERIEVLRDGASAIYGSDAIAGVINIVTNKAARGGNVSYRDGTYFAGDGRSRVVQADAGVGIGDGGYLHLAAQLDDQHATNYTSPARDTFLYYFPRDAAGNAIRPGGNQASNPTLPAGATPDPREATRDNNAWRNRGIRAFRTKTATANASLPLAATVEAYGLLTLAQRDALAPQNFRQPLRNEVVRAIDPDGFAPTEHIDENDGALTLGVRGQFGEWDWDLSSGYGRDAMDINLHNSINPTYGLDSQTDFYIGDLRYSAWTHNLDVRRQLQTAWLAAPLELSAGAEYRDERYRIGAGDVQSYTHGGQRVLDGPYAGTVLGIGLGGSQALPGYRPEDAVDVSRNSGAVYVGVAADLGSRWRVDLAGRHERYSDFGSETTGRLSTRFALHPRLALRGTISNGFQAPSLAAQAYRNTSNGNFYTDHILQAGSPQAIALGAQPLRPETSRSLSLGIVAEPWQGASLTVDAYRIDVDDRIALSTTFREGLYPGSGALVTSVGLGAQDGVRYFINAADTRTEGVEATLEGRWDLGRAGALRWTLASSHTRAKITGLAPTPGVLAAFNVPVFSTGSQNELLYKAPKSRQVLGLDWSLGRYRVGLRQSRYGDIQRYGSPTTVATSGPYAGQAEIAYDIGGLWITDLQLGATLPGGWDVALNANNVFDRKVTKLPEPLLAANEYYRYANGGPVDGSGGLWSATVRYRWD